MSKEKKLFHLLAILMFAMLSICISSCGDDDDEVSDSLSGIWEINISDGDSKGTMTFTFKNGVVIYVEKWSDSGYEDDIETYKGTYTIDNDMVTMALARTEETLQEEYTWIFKWKINGKKLTLTPNDNYTSDYWESSVTFSKK